MKRSIKYLILESLLLVSCAENGFITPDDPSLAGTQVLTCNTEIRNAGTRTSLLSDSATVVWQANDTITVISEAGDASSFSLISGAGKTSGSFSGNLAGSGPYTAFYPSSGDASVSEGALLFKLPDSQTYVPDSFGAGASPMVASFDDIATPLQFLNLCGMLSLKLTSKPSLRITKLVVEDLAGNMLWGDCRLTLDGTQGTSGQNLTLSGGDNTITIVMSSPLVLSESPCAFFIVVPPGSFGSGFSVTAYDDMGNAYPAFHTDNPAAVVDRAMITNMARFDIRTEPADPKRRGYYKDLFMNSGIKLNSFTYLAAYPYIGWDYEYFATPFYDSYTETDTQLQKTFFESAGDDENGYILYPDRQPRFRCIFVNGGSSRTHGKSLGPNGRQTVYDFVYNGGSYVGTCAGAFLACRGYDSYYNYEDYFGIFPGHIIHTKIYDTYTDLTVPNDSPLRNYFSFGESVTAIRHNDGGYMDEDPLYVPEGTEILSRYSNCPEGKEEINGKVGVWAYKPDAGAGRIVVTGSHPEKETSGDRRNLFGAMLLYAGDGCGTQPVKASLTKGVAYDCTALSSANTPEHARIGDKQYHHFTVDIPAGATNIAVTLESDWAEEDLYLSIRKDDYAWFSEADYALTTDGSNKTLSIPSLAAGTYYVSVYAPNTVTSTLTTYDTSGKYFKYSGNTRLLDGIPYTITADWTL